MEITSLKQKHLKIMEFYHKKLLDFYSGTKKTYALAHMNFDEINNPKIVLYDGNPVFIGYIEVDKEGVSNFIYSTPLVVNYKNEYESLSMQDFIAYGRLLSLSTIRQLTADQQNKKFFAYQTIDGEKSEKQEIFPLLRGNSSETSYLLRNHLNLLIKHKQKQIEISLSDNQAEYEWLINNEERFDIVCYRLGIVMFKTPSKIILTLDTQADENINLS